MCRYQSYKDTFVLDLYPDNPERLTFREYKAAMLDKWVTKCLDESVWALKQACSILFQRLLKVLPNTHHLYLSGPPPSGEDIDREILAKLRTLSWTPSSDHSAPHENSFLAHLESITQLSVPLGASSSDSHAPFLRALTFLRIIPKSGDSVGDSDSLRKVLKEYRNLTTLRIDIPKLRPGRSLEEHLTLPLCEIISSFSNISKLQLYYQQRTIIWPPTHILASLPTSLKRLDIGWPDDDVAFANSHITAVLAELTNKLVLPIIHIIRCISTSNAMRGQKELELRLQELWADGVAVELFEK